MRNTRSRWTRRLAAIVIAGYGGIAGASTWIVTNTDDDCDILQQCLRRAITLSNLSPDTDTIVFNIPGDPATPKRIMLASELSITQPVVIDGYTQPGSSPNTLDEGTNAQIRIVIDGAGAPVGSNVLSVSGGPSDIRGVAIVNAHETGIAVGAGGAETTLRGNFVGVEPDGVTRAPNLRGVAVYSDFNAIGGAAPADRNLISGNTWSGVVLYEAASIRNAVVGNLIGTDRHAMPVLGNGWYGVQVANARLSRIGGYARELQNVIAGNGRGGVALLTNGLPPGLHNIEVISRIYANSPNHGAIDSDACPLDNDPGDGDTGPNECLNHPVISRARVFNGELVIEGAFDSVPNRLGRVAFYGNTRPCTARHGGETGDFLGYKEIATDAGGHFGFRFATESIAAGYTSVAAIAGVGVEDVFVDATSRVSPCVAVEYADRIFANGF